MSTVEHYLVLELYHNTHAYSSADGQLPIIRAVCSSLEDAAEIIAKQKTQNLQTIVDSARAKQPVVPFVQNLFVVKIPANTFIHPMTLPHIPVTEGNITQETRNKLHAVATNYNSTVQSSNIPKLGVRETLDVTPSSYEKDRKAREWEMMQRLNLRPVAYDRPPVPSPVSNQQPVRPVVNPLVHATNVPTFSGGPTPSLPAQTVHPGFLPGEHAVLTTSVPLPPVTPSKNNN